MGSIDGTAEYHWHLHVLVVLLVLQLELCTGNNSSSFHTSIVNSIPTTVLVVLLLVGAGHTTSSMGNPL
jgi:hypothetical protein